MTSRHAFRPFRAIALSLLLAASALGLPSLSGLATLPAAAQGTKGGGAGPIHLRVITFSVPGALPIAQARGFFASEGLDVENVVTASSQQLMGGTIDGTYDIACTNADNWITYVMRDHADVFLFQGAISGDTRVLVARPEIQSAEDLRGRALAVDAPDSGLVMILWKILADQGLDFRGGDPRLVPVGATEPRIRSMASGETAAGLVSSRELEETRALGFHELGSSDEYLPEYPAPECGTTRRWAAAHEDALVRFIRAYVAATRWALTPANREEAIATYMRETSATRDAAEERIEHIEPDATINIPGIRSVLNLRSALGFLQGPVPPAERFYDTRYWELATGERHP